MAKKFAGMAKAIVAIQDFTAKHTHTANHAGLMGKCIILKNISNLYSDHDIVCDSSFL